MYYKTEIIGNIGTVSELKEVLQEQTGEVLKVKNFTVAVNIKYKETNKVIWFSCSIWNKHAESLDQYLSIGKQVFISGRLDPQIYNSEDGTPKIDLVIKVDKLLLLGNKPQEATNLPY